MSSEAKILSLWFLKTLFQISNFYDAFCEYVKTCVMISKNSSYADVFVSIAILNFVLSHLFKYSGVVGVLIQYHQ